MAALQLGVAIVPLNDSYTEAEVMFYALDAAIKIIISERKYDDLVKRLFRNSLHKADENIIHFARRGNSTRNTALQSSIDKAKANFQAKYNKTINKPVKIIPAYPNEYIGLQIIDYYLWAVQRLYEKGEDRFFQLLANDFRLIMDLDDIRNKDYGEWYSDQNKLDLKKIKPV